MKAFTKKIHNPACNAKLRGKKSKHKSPKASADRRGTRTSARQLAKVKLRRVVR
jgi:hypothetical protein